MLSKSVVMIPTYNRPEFLALTLEQLDRAVDAPDDIRICLDTSPESRVLEIEHIRDKFLPRAILLHARPHTYAPSGTYNILHSIRQGYETGADLIFMLEEDVLIRPDKFFPWHYSQMTTGEYLASCGRKDRGHYPVYGALYTNPGSCLSRALCAEIIPHINDDYFTNLREYLDRALPPNWDEQSNLDDGLIRRVIRKMGGKVAYPEKGVCVHQGWGLYNKIDIYMNEETDVQKRIARLREIISTLKPGDRYAKDFEPF